VPAGVNGGVSIFVTDTSHVILDINGYFVASTAQEFFSVTPCRVFDSRNANGPLGGPILAGQQTRHIPVLSSNCRLPAAAQAYSLNLTAIPQGPLGYLTTWPTGLSRPLVSTLNSYSGTVTANAAIVPAGTSGSVDVFVTDEADVVVDVDGYFAPPSSGPGGLALYTLRPCRVLDTREASGAFAGELTASFLDKCGVPNNSQAYVTNATVVPTNSFGYLSIWPDGENQPVVSTLNSYDGAVTSNMAIVPTTNGSIDSYGSDPTQLILDVVSFFAKPGSQSTFNLSAGIAGGGSGSVASADGNINCPSACSALYYSGAMVTLTAVASSGSTFAGWSGGGCSGTGGCTVQMNTATNVTATFEVIVSNPNMNWNMELDSSCSFTTYWRLFDGARGLLWPDAQHVWVIDHINQVFPETISCTTGDTICLGASLNSGSDTTFWGVGINGTETYSGSLCQVCGNYTVQTQSLSCPSTYSLSIARNGTGTGTVTSSDSLINCGVTCSASYNAGSSVTLSAAPFSGSTFAGWSGGGCSGTGGCTVQMNSATGVTATFNVISNNSNMTWNVELASSCSLATYWRLYDENQSLVWPDANMSGS
jgi:hypothetical protein